MYEPEDEAGWAALPAVSDDEPPAVSSDTIGPVKSSGDALYTHMLQSHSDRALRLASEPGLVHRLMQLQFQTSDATCA